MSAGATADIDEATKDVFLVDEAAFETSQVFAQGSSGDRFPNVVVTKKGTVLAIWGERAVRARRSEDGGNTWSDIIIVAKHGIHSGGATIDEGTGDILVFAEDYHPPVCDEPFVHMYKSSDDGKNWYESNIAPSEDAEGRRPALHMNEHGILLKRGPKRGRLLRASRWYAGGDEDAEFPNHIANLVFSDDGGASWRTSVPFPAAGCGEAGIVELSDGSIYFNTRRHWCENGQTGHRWCARSYDAGETFEDVKELHDLPDGPQGNSFGCFGGLERLPVKEQDILCVSNCDSKTEERQRGTVWVSFDAGATWPLKRAIWEGQFGYSALAAGRAGTASQGWIYCFFEAGGESSFHMARFNLSWLMENP